jgi:predicted MPP superfamily phosphohydrolase
MERFILFMASFLGFIGLTSWFMHFSLRFFGIIKTGVQSKIVALLMIVLPIMVIITMTIGSLVFSKINAIVYTGSALYLAIGALLLLATLIAWTVFGATQILNIDLGKTLIMGVLLVLVFIGFGAGIIEALSPRIVIKEINSKELAPAWGDKKIIFFADSHFGVARNENLSKKIVRMIEKENPDAIFIAGDLIDGPKFPYEKTFRHFDSLNPKIGIFYTAGNHEEYNSEQDKFYEAIPKNFTVLNEKSILVNNTEIVGLVYKKDTKEETVSRFKNIRTNTEIPAITILHDPKNAPALANSESALTLSGHTHGGQFYPFAFFVKAIYGPLTRGVNYFEKGATATTVGVGTAGPVFRLGVRPEIVVIKIK